MSTQQVCSYKVVLLGESSVGKTSLAVRLTSGKERIDERSDEVGTSVLVKMLRLGRSAVRLEVWDLTGHERYEAVNGLHCRDAHAAVVVYDLASRPTFDRVPHWLRLLRAAARYPRLVAALVGNKTDLFHHRAVPAALAKSFALQQQLLFLETSALTGNNVIELAEMIANQLLKQSLNVAIAATTL